VQVHDLTPFSLITDHAKQGTKREGEKSYIWKKGVAKARMEGKKSITGVKEGRKPRAAGGKKKVWGMVHASLCKKKRGGQIQGMCLWKRLVKTQSENCHSRKSRGNHLNSLRGKNRRKQKPLKSSHSTSLEGKNNFSGKLQKKGGATLILSGRKTLPEKGFPVKK